MELALDALKQPKQKESEWIPCSERMPPPYLKVWVTVKGFDFIVQRDGETLEEAIKRTSEERWVTEAYWSEEEKGWNNRDYGTPLINKPIAWMLYKTPKPWEGEE